MERRSITATQISFWTQKLQSIFVVVCSSSFGMLTGEPSTNNPTVNASSVTIPDKRSKLNTSNSWCATTSVTNQFFQYDFVKAKVISGFAIQGDPVFER